MARQDRGSPIRGVVRAVLGQSVRSLMEYGVGERMLCDLPRSFWPAEAPPEPEQHFRLWRRGEGESPAIEVVSPVPPAAKPDTVFVREARELLGFAPGDKVLVVVGPNVPAGGKQRRSRDAFINAGWGEALALTQLPYLTMCLGIRPHDVTTAICEAHARTFDPAEHVDRHVVFLGSTMSNRILRDFYWDKLTPICQTYTFHREAEPVAKIRVKSNGAERELIASDNFEQLDPERPEWEKLELVDYFLVARTRNPYASQDRYHCILSCGAGTIGTGYGVVTLSAAASVRAILDHSEGNDFHMVGRVDMKGFFSPEADPVTLLGFNGEQRDERLLLHSLSSCKVWDDPADYAEDARKVDQETLKDILDRHRE